MANRSNDTWGGMIDLGMRVDLYCDPCGMHEELDLAAFDPDEKAIPMKFRCGCGRKAATIVSPRSVSRAVPYQRVKPGP